MSAIKKNLARKAVKSTAKHSARGTAAKLKRDPVRAITLLGLGGLVGGLAGWLLGRSAGEPAAASTST
jgi:membrane protein YqaA with SNARE-associated domain